MANVSSSGQAPGGGDRGRKAGVVPPRTRLGGDQFNQIGRIIVTPSTTPGILMATARLEIWDSRVRAYVPFVGTFDPIHSPFAQELVNANAAATHDVRVQVVQMGPHGRFALIIGRRGRSGSRGVDGRGRGPTSQSPAARSRSRHSQA